MMDCSLPFIDQGLRKEIAMSVATVPPQGEPVFRLLTVADLAALPSELPSGPVLYELDNGRLIIMPPPGYAHGKIENHLAASLNQQGERRGFGKACSGEVAIVLWRNPDRVVGADAAFIATASLPIRLSKEGYLETIPDLVAEVRSKNDSEPQVQQKVADYLTAEVRVVWVAEPASRTVTVHRPGQEPQILGEDDTLTVEDIIPGFRMAVRDMFQL
jgi:Uma2 family endonuclease